MKKKRWSRNDSDLVNAQVDINRAVWAMNARNNPPVPISLTRDQAYETNCAANALASLRKYLDREKSVKVFIKKNGKYWTTHFQVGVQGFRIDNGGQRTKKEALWYKEMLEIAFSSMIKITSTTRR